MRRSVRNALEHWRSEGLLTDEQVGIFGASVEAAQKPQDSARSVMIFGFVGAVLAVVALFYYLQVARAMYMKPAASKSAKSIPICGDLRIAILICIAFVVGMGVWPKPFIEAADAAVAPFFSTIDAD